MVACNVPQLALGREINSKSCRVLRRSNIHFPVGRVKEVKNFTIYKAQVTDLRQRTSFDERIQKLKQVQRGWLQYYRMASIQGKLQNPVILTT